MLAILAGTATGPARTWLPIDFVAGGALVIAAMTVWDLLAWVSASRAAWRMKRGRPPVAPHVDYGVGEDCWRVPVRAEVPYRAHDRLELVALGSPVAAERLLRKILLRRLAVVSFLVLMPMSLELEVRSEYRAAWRGAARTSLAAMRQAALDYRARHAGACPTLQELVADGALDATFARKDPWGGAYELTCTEDDVVARSAGPDRKPDTADDLMSRDPADASLGYR